MSVSRNILAEAALMEDVAPSEAYKIYALSIDDVSQLALHNNFDIQLAQYDAWIAQTSEGVAESIYDTMFSAEVAYQNDERARTSTILGTRVQDNDYNIGLSKRLPTGTTLGVGTNNNRNASDAVFATSPITYESDLTLSLDQDLGRNFFGIRDRGNIKLTLIDIQNTEYLSLNSIEEALAEIQKTYWALAARKKIVEIEQGMVAQAKALYDLHQEKLEDGLVELPEAIASEANYRSRLNALQLAQMNYENLSHQLRLLLNITNDRLLIEPVDELRTGPLNKTLKTSMQRAFDNRMDYRVLLNDIRAKDIQLVMDKTGLWPEINVSMSLARNGLGEDFAGSGEDVFSENNPDFFTGIQIQFPLENTEARANLKKARLEKARAVLELKYLERSIAVNVLNALRRCEVLQKIAEEEMAVAKLQENKLAEELKRFQWGRSGTDMIIRFQEDVLRAQETALEAQREFHEALIELTKEEGVLLQVYWDNAPFLFDQAAKNSQRLRRKPQ